MPVLRASHHARDEGHGDLDGVTAAMRKHLVDFLFDKLAYFQDFDAVKIYYDDGRSRSRRRSQGRRLRAFERRGGLQAGLFLGLQAQPDCRLHLHDGTDRLKYAEKASTATDEKFFGSWSQFRKGILKEVRAKNLTRGS